MRAPRLTVLLPLLAICVAARIPSFRASADSQALSYLWNFSPLYALCLFSAAMYRGALWRFGAPLAAYLLGSVGILLSGSDLADAFHPSIYFALASLAVIGLCGVWLQRGERNLPRLGLAAAAGSAAFFAITNFGSWACDPLMVPPTGYGRDLAGLLNCYIAAIPFAGQEFLSMVGFSALFFSPVGIAALTRESHPAAEFRRTGFPTCP